MAEGDICADDKTCGADCCFKESGLGRWCPKGNAKEFPKRSADGSRRENAEV